MELGRGASGEYYPRPTNPSPRVNRPAEYVDSQMVPSLERESDLYTRRKDPPTLIPQTQVSEGEGTRYENNLKDLHYNSNVNVKNIINTQCFLCTIAACY